MSRDGIALTLGAVGLMAAASQVGKGQGSRSAIFDRLTKGPARGNAQDDLTGGKASQAAPPIPEPRAPVRQQRSTLADGLIPVGEHGPAWKPDPWVSLDPVKGYRGDGPVLLFGLKSPYAWRNVGDSGIVAPGYPSMWARKRDSSYQIVRPLQSRSIPDRAKYTAQDFKKIRGYPDRRKIGEVQRVMLALVALLDEARANSAQVEVLQAIGLLSLWARNPLKDAGDLEGAVARYLLRSGATVPSYIHDASGQTETNNIVIERSYEDAPNHLEKSQLGAGRKADKLLTKTVGAALRRPLASSWTDKAPDGSPKVRPHYVKDGTREHFVSDGCYALRQSSADWLTMHSPLGTQLRTPKAKPWLNATDSPNLNNVLDWNGSQSLRLVGSGTMVGVGPVVVLHSPNGKDIVVSANKLSTLLAKALFDGGEVYLSSNGNPLDPVAVWTEDMNLEGVVMPVRVS